MTAPVSPDGPTTGDPLPLRCDLWAAPQAEGGAQRAPCPPPAWTPQPGNGMDVTGLVLGLVGVFLGLFVFFRSGCPGCRPCRL